MLCHAVGGAWHLLLPPAAVCCIYLTVLSEHDVCCLQLMKDPVRACDGVAYEQDAIEVSHLLEVYVAT